MRTNNYLSNVYVFIQIQLAEMEPHNDSGGIWANGVWIDKQCASNGFAIVYEPMGGVP